MEFKMPESYTCSITNEIFYDPVITSDGHTYERYAITKWLSNKRTSPITGNVLKNKQLIPNITLKSAINEYLSKVQKERDNQLIMKQFIYETSEYYANKKDDPVALYRLGVMKELDIFGMQDKAESEKLIKKASEMRYGNATEHIAKKYIKMAIMEPDDANKAKALLKLEKAIKYGSVSAIHTQGMFIDRIFKNQKRSYELYTIAAIKGCSLAYYHLAERAKRTGNIESIDMYKKVLKYNPYHTKSLTSLGSLLIESDINSCEYADGMEYLIRATELNDKYALYIIGSHILRKNRDRGMMYLMKAISLGCTNTPIFLARVYSSEQNYLLSEKWLLEALKCDNKENLIEIYIKLGILYSMDTIVRDYKKSAEYVRKLFEMNYQYAFVLYGIYNLIGIGIESNKERAIEIFMLGIDMFNCEKSMKILSKINTSKYNIVYENKMMFFKEVV